MSCPAGPGKWARHVWGEDQKRCMNCKVLNHFSQVTTPEERFWEYTRKDPSGCILWTASVRKNGYGVYTLPHHRTLSAHRCAWLFAFGEIPPRSVDIDHLCRERTCVNVEHMRLVSRKVNLHARPTHGFCKKGHNMEGNTIYRRCGICYRALLERQREARRARGLKKPGRHKVAF